MTGQKALDKFDVVYNESYKDISRYVPQAVLKIM